MIQVKQTRRKFSMFCELSLSQNNTVKKVHIKYNVTSLETNTWPLTTFSFSLKKLTVLKR